jgi:hypothetical protein
VREEAAVAADGARHGRREKAGAGARSLLLTVLGEFVLPRGGEVWTGTLVTALGTLGVEEKSARQALSRTAAEGLLEPARHGRRVRWSLTGAGDRLLREGTEASTASCAARTTGTAAGWSSPPGCRRAGPSPGRARRPGSATPAS